MSLLVGAVKSASFFNQFVNPIGLANLGWKYYIVYCCWLAIVLTVVYFMFPETKVSGHCALADFHYLEHGTI